MFEIEERPGLRQFLKDLHNIYEFHIYTMGTRQYATKITEIIDSGNVLFKEDRILSRDDAGGILDFVLKLILDMNLKNLQRIFPCDNSMVPFFLAEFIFQVLILDDRDDVWKDEKSQTVSPNLIKVEPCSLIFFII